jgi:Type I phosphodiesterase / nucleotide pyrophosphatase
VPLFLFGPDRVPAVGAVAGPATAADIAPTLATHLGFDFPAADGRALPGAAPAPGSTPPRLVVVVVWDGVGRNVLARHPDAWPVLRSLVEEGAWYEDATVGSSPSVTAAVHATIGAGAFPASHGRVANRFRFRGSMAAVEDVGPLDLEVPTLADLWDRSVSNAAEVGVIAFREWHLGMAGRGALFPGGDHDVAVLMDEDSGRWHLPSTAQSSFRLPPSLPPRAPLDAALREVDLGDGLADGRWRGEDLGDPAVALATPAYAGWQTRLLEDLVGEAGFGADGVTDLLFTNYKQADLVGHRWGMESGRMRDAVEAVDAALGELIALVDREVGRGEWVLALTADHGSTPAPAVTGATVIDEADLTAAIRGRFDTDGDDRSMLLALSPSQVWLDRQELRAAGATVGDVARFIRRYGGGRLFAAAFPSRLLALPGCAEP